MAATAVDKVTQGVSGCRRKSAAAHPSVLRPWALEQGTRRDHLCSYWLQLISVGLSNGSHKVGSKKKEYILSEILWKVKGSWPRIDESNHRVLVSNIQANRHFKGQKVDENALLEVAMDFFFNVHFTRTFYTSGARKRVGTETTLPKRSCRNDVMCYPTDSLHVANHSFRPFFWDNLLTKLWN